MSTHRTDKPATRKEEPAKQMKRKIIIRESEGQRGKKRERGKYKKKERDKAGGKREREGRDREKERREEKK